MRDQTGHRAATAAVLALAVLVVPADAQTADNDIFTSNGGDGWLSPSRSVGNPTGVLPPDWAGGNFFFNVLHSDRMHHSSGSMTLTSLEFTFRDSNWTTTPSFYDMALTRADASGFLPDATDPGVVYVSLGTTGLSNPCLLLGDPFGCAGADCVAEGAGVPVSVQVQFPGGGLSVLADGVGNSVLTLFQPGGMIEATSGAPECELGDFVIMPFVSTDFPPPDDDLGEVSSPFISDFYSGFQFQLGAGPIIGPLGGDTVLDVTFGFDEPTLNLRVVPFDDGVGSTLPAESGLASHHLRVDSGLTELGVELHSLDGIGNTAIVTASLSTLPLPGAFVGPYGTKLMLTPDALFNLLLGAGAYVGPIVLVDQGGAPLDDGVFQSSLLSVPASVPDGIELFFQGFELDASNDPVASTNVAKITLWTAWPPPPPPPTTSAVKPGPGDMQPLPAPRTPTVSVAGRTRILDQWTEVGLDGVTRIIQSRIAALVHGDGRVEEIPVRVVLTPRPDLHPVALDVEDVLQALEAIRR